MSTAPASAVVLTSYPDGTDLKNPSARLDLSFRPASYWRAPAYACRNGEFVTIKVRPTHPEGPARFRNGISDYDTTGRRLTPQGEPPNRVWVADTPKFSDNKKSNHLNLDLAKHALIGKFGDGALSWWATLAGTASADNLYLAVNDRFGQFYNNTGTFTVDFTAADFPIKAGYSLLQNRPYKAGDEFQLIFQTDGNLVVYKFPKGQQPEYSARNAVWAINQANSSVKWGSITSVTFGADGNLIAGDSNRATVWQTGTAGNPGARLNLDPTSGALTIATDKVIWSGPAKA